MGDSTNDPIPGALMRQVELANAPGSKQSSSSIIAPEAPCPNIEGIYTAVADDGKKPSHLALYILSDIRPLLSSTQLYDEDCQAMGSKATVAWVICSFVNGRSGNTPPEETSTIQPLTHTPAEGSEIVINGSTPRPDKEADYHGWYNEEHGPLLAKVPGWNENRRYKQEKTYGDVETANFYGVNFYDAENGLGGPVWQASTGTEWTQRIRSNAAKPNIRRVWRVKNIELYD